MNGPVLILVLRVSQMLNHQLMIGKKNAAAQKAATNASCTPHGTFNVDAVWYIVTCTVHGSCLRATPPVHEVAKGRIFHCLYALFSEDEFNKFSKQTVFEMGATDATVNLEGIDWHTGDLLGFPWFSPGKMGDLILQRLQRCIAEDLAMPE